MRLTENIDEVIYDVTTFQAFKLSVKSKLKKKGIGYVLESWRMINIAWMMKRHLG
jgi:hypothetical protein